MAIGESVIPAVSVHPKFLKMLGAPANTVSLSFEIAVDGVLRCKAVYYTGTRDMTATKEWEVQLPRINPLYQLITNGGI